MQLSGHASEPHMNTALPTIAGFWYGSDLSWLEALCIRSYLDRGHRFVLYTSHPVAGLPDGTEMRPAADILWPPPFAMDHTDRLKVAVFSDLFRLRLSQLTDFIWVDLDAYCVKPFAFSSVYVFGRSQTGEFPNGVLRLPPTSRALELMLAFLTSPNPTQPWRGPRMQRRNRQRVRQGESWGIESLPWGSSGPKALQHFLTQTDEDRYAMEADVFYPLAKADFLHLHDPAVRISQIERPNVHSVHVYGHQKKLLSQTANGLPFVGSYLHRLCQRHGIEPEANPIRPVGWLAPSATEH